MAADEEAREAQREHEAGTLDRESYEAALRRSGFGWTTDERGRSMWRDPDGFSLTVGGDNSVTVPVSVRVATGRGDETIHVDMPADMFDVLVAADAALALIVTLAVRTTIIVGWAAVGSAALLLAWVRPQSGAWVTCLMLLALGVVMGIKARRRT